MIESRRRVVILLALAIGLALAPLAEAQRPDRIKIGGTVPVTGRFSSDWGPGIIEFMKAWEKLVNADGGVFVKEYNAKLPIELVLYDDESSPEKSVELYEKLAAVDKVHLFMGPGSSPITLRASTVAERLKIPMLLVEANSPIIYARGFQWIAGVDRPAQYWSIPYFDLIKELREKKVVDYRTIAFLIEDHPHTKDIAEGSIELARKAGLEVVATESVPFRTSDFSAVIAKFKQVNPDIVYSSGWTVTSVPFVKQMNELGLEPKALHVIHLVPEFGQQVGPALAEGVTGETHIARKHLDQRYLAILKQLEVDDPYPFKSLVLPIRYLALETMRRGIEAAGTLDREKFMASLRTLRFDTPHGPHRFNYDVKLGNRVLNGMGEKYLYAGQFQNGKIVIVGPANAADGPYKPTPRR
ncbi:MAG: amino acid ABC transporter substrate-binding protein [Candidatus Rokuibacteriota bacterium]